MDRLEKLDVVKEAALFGNSIHAVVADSKAAIPDIKKLFTQNKAEDFSVVRIEPTLEDVFVSLIETYDEEHK